MSAVVVGCSHAGAISIGLRESVGGLGVVKVSAGLPRRMILL